MGKRLLTGMLGTLAVLYAGLSAYAIASQSIEDLLLCADGGGLKIPFSKTLCRRYLFAFRGSAADMAELQESGGASFVVQGRSSPVEREQVLRFLIGKGLDVNRPDRISLPPLHAAVLAGAADEVAILLRNGAVTTVRDGHYGLTPLELAQRLQSERKKDAQDWQPIITQLQAVRPPPG
jgi:hypothetical protein